MKQLYFLLSVSLLLSIPVTAQDLSNNGARLTIRPGATLYVGKGGLTNQANSTLTNAGTLRVDGNLVNTAPAILDLGSGSIELHGNFVNAGSLLAGTSVITFSGTTDELFSSGGAALYQIIVDKPTAGANTLRLTSDLVVSNFLRLVNGQVSTQAPTGTVYTLHLLDGATLSGEASGRFVTGALQVTRAAVNGAAVDFGNGAVLDPTTNNLGSVSITRVAGLLTPDVSYGQNFTNGSLKGIDRIWTVVPTTQPSAPVQLTLSWLPDNDNGITAFNRAQLWQQVAAGQPWAALGSLANASARTIISRPTLLNRFTVSNMDSPLAAMRAVQNAGFVVYPTRVTSGQITTYLYSGPAQVATLQVLDVAGRLVRTVAVDGRAQGQVPLAGLAVGTYLLHYTTATVSYSSWCVIE